MAITRSVNSPVVVYHFGLLINLPKSMIHSTKEIEFLGFMVDTVMMIIALPSHKVEAIQKVTSKLLTQGSVLINTGALH